MPNLDFVAIWIDGKQERFAGAEFTVLEYLSSGALHLSNRRINIRRIQKPKPEVYNASALAGSRCILLENDDITCAGNLDLQESVGTIDLHDTKDRTEKTAQDPAPQVRCG